MKTVIDVNVIGLAQLYETARTGIYRTISNLTEELLRLGPETVDIRYTSLSSNEVGRLTDSYFCKRGLASGGFQRNALEDAVLFTSRFFPGRGKWNIPGRLLSKISRNSLRRRIDKTADIFHSMYSPLPAFERKSLVRMLTIYDLIPLLHPEYFEDGFLEQFRPIVTSFNREKDFLFAISECTKQDICDYFKMSPERIFVTPLAAARDLYYPVTDQEKMAAVRKRYKIPESPYFLSLATVEKRKNLATSVAGFRKLINEPGCGDIHLVLVGTRGWKVDDVIATVEKDVQLKERVHFTGFLPDEVLSILYSGAIAFLYPSLYEGFGLPPLEAMQCGLPVISSNTSSLPEVVGDAGILIEPENSDDMAEAMCLLLNKEDVRAHYSEKGIRRAAMFSWKACAEKTVAGYHRAWDGRERSLNV